MTDNPLDNFGLAPLTAMGQVVGGSLSAGLDVKLDPAMLLEGLAVGRYVVIHGKQTGRKFFGLITDIALDATNPDIAKSPPDVSDRVSQNIYGSAVAFGVIHVSPMLALDDGEPKPVKTIPSHFSPVFEATEEDVNTVFGKEDDTHFYIGSPLDMESVKVNLDLERFVQRSSGVFGKSGTGKSFITRTILAGVIKANVASTLIFDMHNDYGWEVENENRQKYKGLKQLFSHRNNVNVITLDPETSRKRGSKYDAVLQIGLDQIEPEDVEMLSGILGLSEVQVGSLFYLYRNLGKDWIAKLLDEDDTEAIDELEESEKVQKGTLRAIQRKFELFRRFDFLTPTTPPRDLVEDIFLMLNRQQHVILEFGTYGNTLAAYVLVANYLTRRVHKRYVDKKNESIGRAGEKMHPLMVVIEEAHKFLDPAIAQHTIFGTIAREMRKYNVTLLLIDQRPSGIEEEVMSQIGTRVTCLLDNEADIKAVFSGVSGAGQLREVLARLDTQQQALILGHAVPMPVVIKTRDYDEKLYAAVGGLEDETTKAKRKQEEKALFG